MKMSSLNSAAEFMLLLAKPALFQGPNAQCVKSKLKEPLVLPHTSLMLKSKPPKAENAEKRGASLGSDPQFL